MRLDKRAVAQLSLQDILQMRRGELMRVIRAAQLPLVNQKIGDHILYYDRDTLQRLAFLARRCCQNQE